MPRLSRKAPHLLVFELMAHGRNHHHHHHSPVDLASQKTDRRRGMSLAAPLPVTAKTIAVDRLGIRLAVLTATPVVCARSLPDAACLHNAGSRLAGKVPPNPSRIFQTTRIRSYPPGNTGASSLRSFWSHSEMGGTTPAKQAFAGLFFSDIPRDTAAFPSFTAKPIGDSTLALRARAQSSTRTTSMERVSHGSAVLGNVEGGPCHPDLTEVNDRRISSSREFRRKHGKRLVSSEGHASHLFRGISDWQVLILRMSELTGGSARNRLFHGVFARSQTDPPRKKVQKERRFLSEPPVSSVIVSPSTSACQYPIADADDRRASNRRRVRKKIDIRDRNFNRYSQNHLDSVQGPKRRVDQFHLGVALHAN